MKYKNLAGLLDRFGIPESEIAKSLGISKDCLEKKMSGEREFTVDEAVAIQEGFFPGKTLEYLFCQ